MTALLESALVKARERLLSGAMNERQVSQGPVFSILQALGWDTFNVDSVIPEYSVGSRRVDYALKATPSRTDVFLEIKAPGKADDAADQQLFEYAFHEGVPFAVLTDGRIWNFYLPSGQGNYQDRRLFKLDIVERELTDACERLERYLAFERVKNGRARTDAVREYEDRFQRNKVTELIPKVWQVLMAEPDDLLCDVLMEAVEAQAGQRPLREDVIAFFQAANSAALPNAGVAARNVMTRAIPTLPAQLISLASAGPSSSAGNIGFCVADGKWNSFRNGKQCYVGIIHHLVDTYPKFCSRFQSAKTRGKRAWISKNKEELFPGRPDFQKFEVTAVGAGWLVGTQMSAHSEMPKRVEAACACVGLVFGRDVKATFL